MAGDLRAERKLGLVKKIIIFVLTFVVVIAAYAEGSYLIAPQTKVQESGPISVFPVRYLPVCKNAEDYFSASRVNATHLTTPGIDTSTVETLARYNTNLTVAYDRIIHSPSFLASSQGHGWVVQWWGFAMLTGRPRLESGFILTNPDKSVFGYLYVIHNLDTGSTFTWFAKDIHNGCPGRFPYTYMTIDKLYSGAYLPGEPVKITWSFGNSRSFPVVYSYSPPCAYGFHVYRIVNPTSGNKSLIYDSFKHGVCPDHGSSFAVGPGQKHNATFIWNQTDDSGQAVGPGAYCFGIIELSESFRSGCSMSPAILIGTPSPSEPRQFKVTMSTGAPYFYLLPWEKAMISVQLVYDGPNITSIALPPCAFSFSVSDSAGAPVYSSQEHEMCTASPTQVLLAPMRYIPKGFSWNLTDDAGNRLKPGQYVVTVSVTFSLDHQNVSFAQESKIVIQPPGG